MTVFLTSTMCLLGKMIPLLQLLYLQRLVEIEAEKYSTTIFPIPIDTIAPLSERANQEIDVAIGPIAL